MRAGAYALSLLATPLNVHVLQALEDEPKALIDLRRAVGSPPQTTMRGHLRRLAEIGVLERQRQNDFPGNVDLQLARPGRDLLAVMTILRQWLRAAPTGPVELGTPAAKSATKAMFDGWSSTIVRALAARPLSLTDLNRLISDLNYPSLERRLGAMRLAGLIEACPGRSRGTPYKATAWLRHAVAPLAAAARWEREHVSAKASPIGRLDIEAAFLLTVPMATTSPSLSGVARLAVDVSTGSEHHLAGVQAKVVEGRVMSCTSRLGGDVDAVATGTAPAWIRAILDGESDQLELGGDSSLASELIWGLHRAPALRRGPIT